MHMLYFEAVLCEKYEHKAASKYHHDHGNVKNDRAEIICNFLFFEAEPLLPEKRISKGEDCSSVQNARGVYYWARRPGVLALRRVP